MKTFTLWTGAKMPAVGLGTYKLLGQECYDGVLSAINQGYRLIDTASMYDNENIIGEALQEAFKTGLKREEIFITTKAWPSELKDVRGACMRSIEKLKCEYLDLYMIHWPLSMKMIGTYPTGIMELDPIPMHTVYAQLEELYYEGIIKQIGVCNFTVALLLDTLAYARVKPAVLQVEIHPYNVSKGLVEFAQRHGVQVVGYGSLGGVDYRPITQLDYLLEHPIILELAEKYNRDPSQILLSWSLTRKIAVIPKSKNPERQLINLKSGELELTTEEVDRISTLDKKHRFYGKALMEKLQVPLFED